MGIIPNDFIEMLTYQQGIGFTENFCQCILETESPVSIRFQKDIKPSEPSEVLELLENVPWEANAYYLKARPNFSHDPLWHAGVYYVQEASSMILGYLLKKQIDSFAHLKVLDLCAAPGGKSTQLLSILEPSSYLVCNEVLPKRAQILKENIVKSGYTNVCVSMNSVKDFSRLQNLFDIVIVDAPCSGEGLFRKDHRAISEWSLESIGNCVHRQREILSQALHLVNENGYLVYSTCTYNQSENIEQVKFLLDSGFFESIELSVPTEFGFEAVEKEGAHGLQAFPNRVKGEGFFIAILKKIKTAINENYLQDYFFKSKLLPIDAGLQSLVDAYCPATNKKTYLYSADIISWDTFHDEFIQLLYNNLKLIYCSLYIGEYKAGSIIPSLHLLLSNQFQGIDYKSIIHLDKNNSLKYLRKENVDKVLIPDLVQSTWYQVHYLDYPIGWLKVMPNQKQNNYYPLEWRLRN